jgi:hypothetical protein
MGADEEVEEMPNLNVYLWLTLIRALEQWQYYRLIPFPFVKSAIGLIMVLYQAEERCRPGPKIEI